LSIANMTYRLLVLPLLVLPHLLPALAHAQGTVYRCPGPPVLYTDNLSPKEAADKGCRSIEGAPVSVVQGARPKLPASTSTPNTTPSTASGGSEGSRIDSSTQRARDSDRRTVLQAELSAAEKRLADLKAEYNNGNPERRGDERNYAKYQERVVDLKAQIDRQESDLQAIRRELGKLN
jgi:hypothetical protein